jgi:hypothetical protein
MRSHAWGFGHRGLTFVSSLETAFGAWDRGNYQERHKASRDLRRTADGSRFLPGPLRSDRRNIQDRPRWGHIPREQDREGRLVVAERKVFFDESCIRMDGRRDVDLDGDRRTGGGSTGRRD